MKLENNPLPKFGVGLPPVSAFDFIPEPWRTIVIFLSYFGIPAVLTLVIWYKMHVYKHGFPPLIFFRFARKK